MESVEQALQENLIKKLYLLQKIDESTSLQMNFIIQRKMKGLLRLVAERGRYLQQVQELQLSLPYYREEVAMHPNIQNLLEQIDVLQNKIIIGHQTLLETAKVEQEHIAADLRRVNAKKRLRTSYDYQWVKISGNQLNQKG